MKKKIFSAILALTVAMTATVTTSFAAVETDNKIVILHTNDVHTGIEDGLGYAGVAAYLEDTEDMYGADNVTLVDAGDAIQGGPVGVLTQGEAIIELMNATGYDVFTLGNHEFDYGVPRMMELMDMLDATTVSSNFISLATNDPYYDAYTIINYDGVKVAYVGIATPESFTKSTPVYFQNEDGEYIYSFAQGNDGQDLYDAVQDAVDAAYGQGADYIVALAHLGIDEVSAPWRSVDVIENTYGIDVFIDGHSHSVVEGEIVENKRGEDVILNQTGTKLANLGKIIIDPVADTISAELVMDEEFTEKDADVQAVVDAINAENADLLQQVVAKTDVELYTTDPTTGERIIRNSESNLGDLVADAYRTLLDTDVAIVNGGGIRANIEAGDITYEEIINVHPFGNNATSIKVTGQTILDALEMGSRAYPDENGGFLNVSGMTYKIDESIESSVVTDEEGMFVEVDGEYRVHSVMVGGEALDLDKEYTLASHDYMLLNFGDGMAMFAGAELLKDKFMVDNEVLITYIVQELDGVVGEEYSNPYGEGRIMVEAKPTTETAPETTEPEVEATPETSETVVDDTDDSEPPQTGAEFPYAVVIIATLAAAAVVATKVKAK